MSSEQNPDEIKIDGNVQASIDRTLADVAAVGLVRQQANEARDKIIQVTAEAGEAAISAAKSKGQIDALLSELEGVRQKAQSEALFAFQAKQNCEEHSTFIAQKKGQVEADHNAIGANRKSIEEFAATLATTRAAADGDAKLVAARRIEADEAVMQIAERRQKTDADANTVKDVKAAAEEAYAAVRLCLQTTQQSSDTVTSLAQTVAGAASQIGLDRATAAEHLESTTRTEKNAAEILEKCRKNLVENDSLLVQLQEGDRKYKELLKSLTALKEESAGLRKQVEELLPGATSAQLASSFKQQTERFKWPKRLWIGCFIACILGLIGIAVPAFLQQVKVGVAPTWDSLLLELLHRLPLLAPLVWLTIYAGRNYMNAVRLEEDYAYKEAVSRAFEGYKAQMQSIAGSVPEGGAPLLVLCNNVLKALAERPGRIYETVPKDITPTNLLIDNAAEAGKLLRNKVVAT